MLAFRAVELEEIALSPVARMFLEEEHQLSLIEGSEPVVPAYFLQFIAAEAGEVEAQHAGATVVPDVGIKVNAPAEGER